MITHIYAETSVVEGPGVNLHRLSASLDRWRAGLPSQIKYDPSSEATAPPPHVLSLQYVHLFTCEFLADPAVWFIGH